MDLHTRKGQAIPHPGDQKPSGNQPPQNANTSNGAPAHPVTQLNTAEETGPRPIFAADAVLFRLRMRFPNLQIVPIPTATVTAKLAANVADDMTFPDGTIAILFFSTAPFWCNFEGRAAVPSASGEGKAMFIPPNFPYMLYVQGKKQISVLAEMACVAQAFCYIDIPARDAN